MTYSDPSKTPSPSSANRPVSSSKTPDPNEIEREERTLQEFRKAAEANPNDKMAWLLFKTQETFLAKLKTGELED